MSIIDQNAFGIRAFKQLLKQKKAVSRDPSTEKGLTNKLFVEWARSKVNGDQKASRNQIWYHAKIKHYDATGHLNEGTCVYLINMIAEKQKGIPAIEAELNQDIATKMVAVIDLHKNS